MDDYTVSVKMILKTGHTVSFGAFEFKKTPEGWEFVSYPDKRGFKSVRIVKGDSVASIEIEAPSQFFDTAAAAVTQAIPTPATVMPAPQTYTVPKAVRVPTKDGRPKSVISEFDQEGNEIQMDVGASMVG